MRDNCGRLAADLKLDAIREAAHALRRDGWITTVECLRILSVLPKTSIEDLDQFKSEER